MADSPGERKIPASPYGPAGTKILVAPFQLWLDGADHLRLEGWSYASSTTLQLYGRVLLESGDVQPFQTFIFAPDTVTRVVQDVPMPKGFLLSLVLAVTGATPQIGEVFARASLIRGFTGATVVTATLLQGYIGASQVLSWPGTPLQQADAIDGYVTSYVSVGAAAGNPLTFDAPTGVHWSVLTVAATLTTNATIITRRPYLVPSSAAMTFSSHHPRTVGELNSRTFYWAVGLTGNIEPLVDPATAALPTRVEISPGETITIAATNMQAGDQFVSGQIAVLERLQVL